MFPPALPINATPNAFCAALEAVQPPEDIPLRAEREAARRDYLAWSGAVPEHPGAVQMAELVEALNALPANAVVTNGAGNYAAWLHRYRRVRSFGAQLAPASGSMGWMSR